MEKLIKSAVSVLLVLLSAGSVFGQWINCESKLLKDSLFEVALVDTVKFGENTTPGGRFMELFMHVYEPVNDTSTYRPVLVLAFGGAYIRGEKEDVRPICEMFSSRGYVCASIDYRLFDAFKIPDSTVILDIGLKAREDMIAAIKYFRWSADNGNKWKINPDYIFAGGASSGAITALSVAYLNERDSSDIKEWMKPIMDENGGYEGSSALEFAQDYNYNVSGVANMLGAMVDLAYIDEGEPPVVSIHGTNDDVVPYAEGDIKLLNIPVFRLYGSSLVHEKAVAENVHSTFISVEGGGHGDFLKDKNQPWLDSMVNTTLNDFYDYALCPESSKVEDENIFSRLEIFPNPTSDFITINWEIKGQLRLNIEILTIAGLKVKSFTGIEKNEKLNISGLHNGAYILRVSNKVNDVIGQKVIVVRK